MSESQIVLNLYEAHYNGMLKGITPDNIRVEIDSHSTAKHCHIYLLSKHQKPLLVWYKTNWVSSTYEFNEKNKTIGFQPECQFIREYLNSFFELADRTLTELSNRTKDENASRDQKSKKDYTSFVNSHKQDFLNKNTD